MDAEKTQSCPGCGIELPPASGPVHKYMESSPACWAAFGQVLEREYSTPTLQDVHRLSVDSYAVQHPGRDSRQAIQSLGVHLSRLCLFLERGLSAEDANAAMLRVAGSKASMSHLQRPSHLGEVTVIDVLAASGVDAHREAVRRWARAAWEAWRTHHATVRQWVDAAS